MILSKMEIEQQLNKEVTTLLKQLPTSDRFDRMSKEITFLDFLSNKMLIISVIRRGIPYSFFSLIQHQAPFSENDWADFLDISTKSLHRYKISSRLFKPYQSEKIIEMAEVTNVGLDVFGDIDKFKLWLDTPNYSLENMKPIELLKDSYGKELVISELTRINYGILV